jgi:hypothetical protein
VESTSEDLADGRRRANGPQDPASEPRRALNTFQFQLPGTLPLSGPPAVLTREPHSFGRIMSGCFYDLVRNLFTAQVNRNEAALLTAVQTAARLLIPAARAARPIARYFREIGRLMILEDQSQIRAWVVGPRVRSRRPGRWRVGRHLRLGTGRTLPAPRARAERGSQSHAPESPLDPASGS